MSHREEGIYPSSDRRVSTRHQIIGKLFEVKLISFFPNFLLSQCITSKAILKYLFSQEAYNLPGEPRFL